MSTRSVYNALVLPKFIRARQEYLKGKGSPPGCVDITPELESDMCTATFDDIGIAVTNLALNGPRSVFKNILGMAVTWDAKEFKVYGEPAPVVLEEGFKLDLG